MTKLKPLLLIVFVVFGFFVFGKAKAGSEHNVSGWAWSENIGWISFNNTTGGGTTNYGVNIDPSTGIFSGYAWSENIGWITFNEAELTGCPTAPCQAKLDFSTYKVSGWARVLAYNGGWSGWIRLKDTDYGVWIDTSVTPAEFRDWAWSDMVIGWISFNCKNTGVCATSNYQVIFSIADTTPPIVSLTGAPATWQNTDATASVSCTDTGTGCDTASYKLKTYTSDPGTCSTNYADYTLSSPQTISSHLWVCGTAKDLVGNTGFSAPVEFKIDKTIPSTAVVSPEAGSWQRDDFTAKVMDSDTGGSGLKGDNGCEYLVSDLTRDVTVKSGARVCGEYSFNVPVGSDIMECQEDRVEPIGQATCKVSTQAFDNAGNSSGWKSRNFRIDYTPPIVGKISCAEKPGEVCYPNSPCTTADQGLEKTFCANLSDPVGKVIGCWLYVDGVYKKAGTVSPIPCQNGASCSISVNYAFPASGDHTMRFSCQDSALNYGWGESVTVNVKVNRPPVITKGPSYYTSPCISPATQEGCLVYFSVEATDEDGDSLSYSWIFGDGGTSTEQNPSHHYSVAATYLVTVTVSDGRGGTASKGLTLTVSDPTLSVNLSADPAFGTGSLSGVKLRAIVSGTMTGTINYKFDCTNDGTFELEILNQTTADYTTSPLCNYLIGIHTAKVLVERGTGSASDTTEIKVLETTCTPGETTTCTSSQGCTHTIVCQADSTWPACPSDECPVGLTKECGFCGTQTCGSNCAWGDCLNQGVCPKNSPDYPLCPCPLDKCVGTDYYDYPAYGDCDSRCQCSTGTGIGQPCQPDIIENDPQCQITLSVDLKVALDSLNWQESLSGTAPVNNVDVKATVTGTATGLITYKFDCQNDGIWDLEVSTETNPYQKDNLCNYLTPKTYTVRVYVERGGKSAEDSATIYVYSNPPTAQIGCDNSQCGLGSSCGANWIAYNRNCNFTLVNNSTDPDNDITKSVWSIFYQGGTPWADPWITCNDNPETPVINEAICNLTLPSLPASQSYYAKLYVEDKSGLGNSSYSPLFYVRREAIAEFDCSLSPEGEWGNCEELNPAEGVVVYFRDRSWPSEGASQITNWSWTFKDGDPPTSSEENPSAGFQRIDENSGNVTLEITDNIGRKDKISHRVFPTIPLPKWKEIPPI